MSDQEIRELKKGIILTASYYGRDLKPDVISMMASDLEDLPFAEVAAAFQSYRRNPKNRTFPLPAQIRELVEPPMNPEAQAREIVERIKRAIADFGYMQGVGARDYIGEVGWNLVRNLGGWYSVCTSDFTTNSGMIAQARQVALDQVQFGKKLNDFDRIEFKSIPQIESELQIQDKLDKEKARQVSDLIELLKKANEWPEDKKTGEPA